jgi:hypothetical protein
VHALLELFAELFPGLIDLASDKKARLAAFVILLCLVFVIGTSIGLTVLVLG